jgi:hypothetical protein
MMMTANRMSEMGTGSMTMPMGGMMPGMMSPMSSPMMPAMMLPHCTMKMEKIEGGMRCTCSCDDKTQCAMMQNMAQMMGTGMCSMCCMMNGMVLCQCNMMMGMCKMEMTAGGMVMTCTSGDKMVCDMIQACCECMTKMMAAGACCVMMMSGMPMCCSC